MEFNSADEVFSKLYSEQRNATEGEVAGEKAKTAGLKALAHPFKAVRNKRAKSWTTTANDDGFRQTAPGHGYADVGFKTGKDYKQVGSPGSGRLL